MMVLDRKGGRSGPRPSTSKKRRFHGNEFMEQTDPEELPSAETLREAILCLEEPVVFNNLLWDSDGKNLWKFLDWNLTDLSEKFGDLKLPFRIGFNAKTPEPQWDLKCKVKSMTMEEFLKNVESFAQINEWLYFDYKYMHEWFNDNPELLSSIDWQRFGFDKQGADSTLWIGSQGAHTNCHQDSYSCNLVCQTHGRKRWLLFPPDSGLKLRPTRIPYEESTVYSSFNFFCPSKEEEKVILKIDPQARMVVLEPGQVLLVPSGWWHYVESIDLSISINTWLPLAKDCYNRLGEAVVKLLVNEIGKGLISTSGETLLASSEAVGLIQTCIEQCNDDKVEALPPEKKIKTINWSAKKFIEKYSSHVSLLPVLETRELQELLSRNRIRFPDIEREYSKENEISVHPLNDQSSSDLPHKRTTNILVNSLCHPDVIAKVTELLLEANQLK